MRTITVRNKNALLELIGSGARFEKIAIADDWEPDQLASEVLKAAAKAKIMIEKTPYRKMSKFRSGAHNEYIVGYLIPHETESLSAVLDGIYEKDQFPFFILLNRVDYPTNIGSIARSAFAAGVNGILFQGDESEVLNEETIHISLGAIARIPLIKCNIFEALDFMAKNGIPTYALDMSGKEYFAEDLSGPAAFVLGAEREGLSEGILTRTTKKLSIPMQTGIDSLNVGVSAALIMYEKVRQDRSKK
jgi:23S rRNA (guanosine2251-2'-O)-methyltransferase